VTILLFGAGSIASWFPPDPFDLTVAQKTQKQQRTPEICHFVTDWLTEKGEGNTWNDWSVIVDSRSPLWAGQLLRQQIESDQGGQCWFIHQGKETLWHDSLWQEEARL